MALEPERFWDAFQRAGILEGAVVHLPARNGELARDVPVSVDYTAAVAQAFEGDVRGINARIEYPTASLPTLVIGDQVTVREKRQRVATHPELLGDGDFSIVELGAI